MKVKEESEKVGLKLNIQKMKIMASGPITSWQVDGENGQRLTLLFGLQNHCRRWLQPGKLKMLTPWKESFEQPRLHIKKQRHYFVHKGPSSQGYGFPSSHVWMWELDYKESWVPKNWCFWTVALEKTLESPLDCRRSNQCIVRRSVLGVHWVDWCWSWNSNILATWWEELTHLKRPWKLGKIEGRRTREWQRMRWLVGITYSTKMSLGRLRVGDGQGGLSCCGSWGCKESDMTERPNWTELN